MFRVFGNFGPTLLAAWALSSLQTPAVAGGAQAGPAVESKLMQENCVPPRKEREVRDLTPSRGLEVGVARH